MQKLKNKVKKPFITLNICKSLLFPQSPLQTVTFFYFIFLFIYLHYFLNLIYLYFLLFHFNFKTNVYEEKGKRNLTVIVKKNEFRLSFWLPLAFYVLRYQSSKVLTIVKVSNLISVTEYFSSKNFVIQAPLISNNANLRKQKSESISSNSYFLL